METPFSDRRRQMFLSEPFAQTQIARRQRMRKAFTSEILNANADAEGLSLLSTSAAENVFEELLLLYTAGEPIEKLRGQLEDVVLAYEHFQKALAAHEKISNIAPLGIGRIDDYERCMQLIGLCFLLHRRDLLPRIAALQDPGYAGEDALYEDLLSYALKGRYDTNQMLHIEPYETLLQAMYLESDEESIESIKKYVQSWYSAFTHAPWHDSHLRINGTEGDYCGYWAFEAGAVAYLLQLDDRSIDDMVYPKELMAWAREHAYLVNEEENQSSQFNGDRLD